MKQANAWPNYESDYRPLVEFAKQKNLPVIAANAPKSIVRCIGRQGLDYINKLDDDQRMFIAQAINTGSSPYKEKFMASMHHGKPEQT
ncbi:ChaN family lipoprotein, partial [Escherichia coli]|nr:ChaN family lipoprotein [Escherichia coli]